MGTSHSRSLASVREVVRPVRYPLLILLLTAALVLGFASAAFANGNLQAVINAEIALEQQTNPAITNVSQIYKIILPWGDATITNLDELAAATSLQYFTAQANPNLDDISALANCGSLHHLNLVQCPKITSIAAVQNLHLAYVSISSAKLHDLRPLNNSASTLRELHLYYCDIESVADLSGLTNLTHLSLDWNNLTDVGALTTLTQLQVAYLDENFLDLTPGSQDMVNIASIQANNPWSNNGVFTYTPQRTPPTPHAADIVTPGTLIPIHFDSVTSEGTISAEQVPVAHPAPGGFQIAKASNGELAYYRFTPSGLVFAPYAHITLRYDDAGLTLQEEQNLKFQHWNGSAWEDITEPPVDTLNNTITGRTTSFSDFAVFVTGEEPPEPPAVSTPASSAWTLVLLAALGLGAGILAMRRRRVQ